MIHLAENIISIMLEPFVKFVAKDTFSEKLLIFKTALHVG